MIYNKKFISSTLFLALAFIIYQFLHESNRPVYEYWPDDGQKTAMSFMKNAMEDHDCEPQFDPWSKRSDGTSIYEFHEENSICKRSYVHAGWKLTEATATAYFRCDLGDRFAEYAVTIFHNEKNIPDLAICQYVILPNISDRGVGENIKIREPIPRFPSSAYDEKKLIPVQGIDPNPPQSNH